MPTEREVRPWQYLAQTYLQTFAPTRTRMKPTQLWYGAQGCHMAAPYCVWGHGRTAPPPGGGAVRAAVCVPLRAGGCPGHRGKGTSDFVFPLCAACLLLPLMLPAGVHAKRAHARTHTCTRCISAHQYIHAHLLTRTYANAHRMRARAQRGRATATMHSSARLPSACRPYAPSPKTSRGRTVW